ncbi:lariocidin/triculamin family lasso peptide core domain [Gordonia sputi]
MSHKSKPGDGTQGNGVKGGGLYMRHHARTESGVRRLVADVRSWIRPGE